MSQFYAVKALDDYQLDVLGVPFGSPLSKDTDGEYFDAKTNLVEDRYPAPPIVYYHGWDAKGLPAGEPVFIGRTISSEKRTDGQWYRVALDKANEYARRIWTAAKKGLARASTGSIAHLVRVDPDGHIRFWPVAELSLLDATDGRAAKNNYAVAIPVLKAVYQQAGLSLPDEAESTAGAAGAGDARSATGTKPNTQTNGARQMEPKEIQDMIAAALKADRDAQAAEAAKKAEEEKAAAIKAENDKLKAENDKLKAEAGRLPTREGGVPYVAKMAELRRYDDLSLEDQAVVVGVLQAAKACGHSRGGASEEALKALAVKAIEGKGQTAEITKHALKASGFEGDVNAVKANELNQTTLATYGDEWVGTAYSDAIWRQIVQSTFVSQRIPAVIIPQGVESLTIPLDSTYPTFYKVAQAASIDGTTKQALPLVATPTKVGTGQKVLTAGKLGARVDWGGELEEDTFVPWAPEVRRSLETEGAAVLEHIIIDGDTEAGNTANINDIGGQPAGTEAFMLFDGFRKLALVTNSGNSRDGGAFTAEDFIETLKLMGAAGMNALDMNAVSFILGPNEHWAALNLVEVKTRDVFANPTLENGRLTSIYGYKVDVSANVCRASAVRLSNANGKIDLDTTANNTKGSLLATRWDQWRLGYKRRMSMETERQARSDSYAIYAYMRVGLTNRDNEAAAISYNLTV